MSSLKEFRCEICGTVSEKPIHWFVIDLWVMSSKGN
jgi:hypothetical protein